MGERLECFVDMLAMCNISESPNAVPEISKFNDSNTSFDELEVHSSWTLVFLLLRVLRNTGLIFGLFHTGYTWGRVLRIWEFIHWANKKIFNPTGAHMQFVGGQAFLQPLPIGGQGQGLQLFKTKKKKKFHPPMYNPPSRTPHIPVPVR